MGLGLDPLCELIAEGAEPQEEVLRIAYLHRVPLVIEDVHRIAQVHGVEYRAAVVALIAPGVLEPARRARAAHVAVRQEALEVRRVGNLHLCRVDVALLLQHAPERVHHVPVVIGHGGGEEVERDAHALPRFEEGRVVALDQLTGGNALAVGAHGDGRSVGVAAGDHEHLVAAHTVIAREYVSRQVCARQVTEVEWAVGIGPGDPD